MISSDVKNEVVLETPTAPVPIIKTEQTLMIPMIPKEGTVASPCVKRKIYDLTSSCDENDDGDAVDAGSSPPSKRLALNLSIDAPPVAVSSDGVKTEPVPQPALKPRNGILSIKSKSSKSTQRNKPSSTKEKSRKGHFGAPDCRVGTMFESRLECSSAGVHLPSVAGISHSTSKDSDVGAYSIVLNGGYEDDVDAGDTVIYTGAGGQPDAYNGADSQVMDQSFDKPANAALKLNCITGRPVRVIRGHKNRSSWAPDKGYRYDGLYKVMKYSLATGKSGHKICRFVLERLPGQKPLNKLPRTY